jgi:hypothetical protein
MEHIYIYTITVSQRQTYTYHKKPTTTLEACCLGNMTLSMSKYVASRLAGNKIIPRFKEMDSMCHYRHNNVM